MQQVGKNPLGLEAMQQGGESSQDKTVQKCVKACLAYCSQQITRSPTQNLLILHWTGSYGRGAFRNLPLRPQSGHSFQRNLLGACALAAARLVYTGCRTEPQL